MLSVRFTEILVEMYTFGGDGRFIGKVEKSGYVEDSLGAIVKDEKAESEPSKVHHVGGSNRYQVNGSISNSCWHIFSLDLLEIELWVAVQPVGQLDDKEEFEHESHGNVGVIPPES